MAIIRFTEEDVEECVRRNHSKRFEKGWEVYKVFTKDFYAVKIRRPYLDEELAFNEDGYKYDMIQVSVYNTHDYLFFMEKGYDVKSML